MCSALFLFHQFRPLAPTCLAILLTLSGCARTPVRLDVSPSRGSALRASIGPLSVVGRVGTGGIGVAGANPPRTNTSASAAQVLATADRYIGTRYRYGGESPNEGFDCSGFVQFVFGRNGLELPRTSYQQASAGRRVPGNLATLRPGDLMFFATQGGRVDHVAIYAGDGRVIHATSGAGVVRYDDLETDRGEWLLKRLVSSRRVLPGAQTT